MRTPVRGREGLLDTPRSLVRGVHAFCHADPSQAGPAVPRLMHCRKAWPDPHLV